MINNEMENTLCVIRGRPEGRLNSESAAVGNITRNGNKGHKGYPELSGVTQVENFQAFALGKLQQA